MGTQIDSLRTCLNEKHTDYEIIWHEKPIRSAKDGSRYFNIEPGQTAPVLIVSAEDTLYGVIFSGARKRINLHKVAKLLKIDAVSMASKEEIRTQVGYEVGAVPLVGLTIPCIVDARLYHYDYIYGGTGDPNYTLKIQPDALQWANKMVLLTDEL